MAREGDVPDNETEVAIFSFYPISTLIFWVLSSGHFIMPLSFTLLASQFFVHCRVLQIRSHDGTQKGLLSGSRVSMIRTGMERVTM